MPAGSTESLVRHASGVTLAAGHNANKAPREKEAKCERGLSQPHHFGTQPLRLAEPSRVQDPFLQMPSQATPLSAIECKKRGRESARPVMSMS